MTPCGTPTGICGQWGRTPLPGAGSDSFHSRLHPHRPAYRDTERARCIFCSQHSFQLRVPSCPTSSPSLLPQLTPLANDAAWRPELAAQPVAFHLRAIALRPVAVALSAPFRSRPAARNPPGVRLAVVDGEAAPCGLVPVVVGWSHSSCASSVASVPPAAVRPASTHSPTAGPLHALQR